MTTRLFGTDGIRARAGEWPLTPEFTLRLGRALGHLARQRSQTPVIVVGRDTRRSGALLESALLAGIMAQGVDVTLLDEFTTPGVSFLAAHHNAVFGVVISASHNPYWDNGIKVFDGNGFKASDELELQIEQLALDDGQLWHENNHLPLLGALRAQFPEGADQAPLLPGVVQLTRDLGENYVSHLLRVFGGPGALRGLRVVLDCANGAASYLAPEVFRRLGVEVVGLNVWPNGVNINVHCGTEGDGPQRAGLAVTAAMADIGFVFDGDADRCKFVDETGVERDGDYILAILARDLLAQGKLSGNTVVTTQMANLGLDLSLREVGVRLERTQVGDKWVSQCMRDGGFVLGGEQSGHIILFEHGLTTGDGLYTALRMSQLLLSQRERGQSFSNLASNVLRKAPQVLVKADVPAKPALEDLPAVQEQIQRSQAALGADTLINVRYSGTEPVVRVMIQGAGQRVEALQGEAQAILQAVVGSIVRNT
ncbi:MAG TPA: phosphoglucosamine mutase [Anaerolineae bacterium]|nr:phosphoglucosamine mutase [Anaerolineae bacterium]